MSGKGRMAPQILRLKGEKHYVTWATARKHGAVSHPELWECRPGSFIAIRSGAGSAMDASDATVAYQEGDVVIAPPDVAWVDNTFRPLSSLRLNLPKGWSAAHTADAITLRKELMKNPDRLQRYEIWTHFVSSVNADLAALAAGTLFGAGKTLLVRLGVQLRYNQTLKGSGEVVERLTDPKTILWAFKTPKAMTLEQVRDAVYASWSEKHYTTESPHEPIYNEVSAKPVSGPITLGEQPMASLNWMYHSVPDIVEHPTPNMCVIDYLMYEIGINGRNRDARLFTRATLIEKLGEQPTSNRLMEFVRSLKTVSAYAVTPCMEVYDSVVAEGKTRATIMFINNNGHCYPITDEHQRHNIAHTGRINLGELSLLQFDEASTDVYPVDLSLKTKDEQTNIINLKPIIAWCDAVPETARVAVVTMPCVAGLCAALINRDRVMVEQFQVRNGNLTAFKHPTRDLTVIAGDAYHARKSLADKYYAKNLDAEFVWRNQSWGVLGMAIMESCYATVPKAHYSADLLRVFEHSPTRAYIAWPGSKKMTGQEVAIDQRRSYTGTLINAGQPWYLGQSFDFIRPFTAGTAITPGEYLIARDILMGRGTIRLVAGWYPHQLITYALKHGYLKEADLSHFLPASTTLQADFFKAFATDMYTDYPDYKGLVNAMIGCLGILHNKRERCGVTNSVETAFACISDAKLRPNTDASVMSPAIESDSDGYGGGDSTYFINVTESTVRPSGHMSLYRQVIAQSYVNLDRQVQAVCTDETEILGYNTDCIKISGPYNEDAVKEKSDCLPGEYHREEKPIQPYGPRPSELPEREAFTFAVRGPVRSLPESELVAHVMAGGSAVVTGVAGSGKTELARIVVEMLGDNVEYIGTAVSNKACENLKERGLKPVRTLTALLVNPRTKQLEIGNLANVNLVIADEYSMIAPDVMGTLVRAKETYGLQVLLLGDQNQTAAITDAPVDYINNPVFMEFAGNTHVVCAYKGFEFPEKARYAPELYHALDHFLRTGTIAKVMRRTELPTCRRHLTYTNNRRNIVNNGCLIQWAEEHGADLVDIGKLYVAPGLELMCYNDTDHGKGLYKTNLMTVVSIDSARKMVTLKDADRSLEMAWKEAGDLFDYAFATTIHKYQGGKITEPFIIHEAHKMDRELLYTAMSRATKLEDVNIADVEDWTRVYSPREYPLCTTLRVKPIKREPCNIYRIKCADGKTYIGRTAGTIEDRLQQHLAKPTSDAMAASLTPSATIELLQAFTFHRPGTADAIETEWIAREIATRGAECVLNGKQLPGKKPAAAPTTRTKSVKLITPCDNTAKSRYEVRWRAKFIPTEHQIRRYSYLKCDKEVALAEAVAWIAELLKLYA